MHQGSRYRSDIAPVKHPGLCAFLAALRCGRRLRPASAHGILEGVSEKREVGNEAPLVIGPREVAWLARSLRELVGALRARLSSGRTLDRRAEHDRDGSG